jgi:DNA-nicking Smr family endonuclease
MIKIFQKNINMDKTLDLHGLKHEHVYRTVDQFIGGHIIKRTSEISIITGRSIKMKEIVSEILTDYHITPQEEFANPGKLIISLK